MHTAKALHRYDLPCLESRPGKLNTVALKLCSLPVQEEYLRAAVWAAVRLVSAVHP